jgi:hypothetical protein
MTVHNHVDMAMSLRHIILLSAVFVVSGCQPSSIFELVEAALDHVTQGVDCGIDGKLDQPVSFGRDHRGAAALLHIFANEVRVIALVGEQHLGCWPVGIHDRQIAFEIGYFAAGQGKGYGQAQRIDAEMDLGREATF